MSAHAGTRRAPFANAGQGRLLLLYEHFFMFLLQKFANISRHIMKSATLLETENMIKYYHSLNFEFFDFEISYFEANTPTVSL